MSVLLTSGLCNKLKVSLITYFFSPLLCKNISTQVCIYTHIYTHAHTDWYNLETRAVSDGYRKRAVAWEGRTDQDREKKRKGGVGCCNKKLNLL